MSGGHCKSLHPQLEVFHRNGQVPSGLGEASLKNPSLPRQQENSLLCAQNRVVMILHPKRGRGIVHRTLLKKRNRSLDHSRDQGRCGSDVAPKASVFGPNGARQIIKVFEDCTRIKQTKSLWSPECGHHAERVQGQKFRVIAENIDDPLLDRQLKAFQGESDPSGKGGALTQK